VILSAGAFDSPKLLMLSGIGDAAHLQALGISVVVDSGCRSKLKDHVVVSVVYQATQNLHFKAPVVSGSWIIFCIAGWEIHQI